MDELTQKIIPKNILKGLHTAMAKVYFEKLLNLVNELKRQDQTTLLMEVKHFFNGAALYVDGTICVSWSPAGLAFKLPGDQAEKLIAQGKAKPLKYFDKGHVKKGYAVFPDAQSRKTSYWKKYFAQAFLEYS